MSNDNNIEQYVSAPEPLSDKIYYFFSEKSKNYKVGDEISLGRVTDCIGNIPKNLKKYELYKVKIRDNYSTESEQLKNFKICYLITVVEKIKSIAAESSA